MTFDKLPQIQGREFDVDLKMVWRVYKKNLAEERVGDPIAVACFMDLQQTGRTNGG